MVLLLQIFFCYHVKILQDLGNTQISSNIDQVPPVLPTPSDRSRPPQESLREVHAALASADAVGSMAERGAVEWGELDWGVTFPKWPKLSGLWMLNIYNHLYHISRIYDEFSGCSKSHRVDESGKIALFCKSLSPLSLLQWWNPLK